MTGGSSALAVVPAAGISLADKIATNRLLLACGADIVGMNAVRKHLSAIKGGLLGLAPAAARSLNFTASDVVGDPLDYVTDLTVPDRSTWAGAQATCDRLRPVGRAAGGRRGPPASRRSAAGDAQATAGGAHVGHGRRRAHVRRGGGRSRGAGLRARSSSASIGRARRARAAAALAARLVARPPAPA